jgi:AcrR family transcriptional regulator
MDTRAHIVQCAFRLFVQHSYKEVTLAQLTKAAGLSKGALYHYFDSKEHLFEAVVDKYFFLTLRENCYKDLADTPTLNAYFYGYLRNLDQVFEVFGSIFGEGPLPALNMYQLSFDAFRYLNGVSEQVQTLQLEELALWQAAVARGIASGELQADLNARQVANMLLAMLDGVAIRLVMEQRIMAYNNESILLFENFYALIKHPNYVATVPNNP